MVEERKEGKWEGRREKEDVGDRRVQGERREGERMEKENWNRGGEEGTMERM